MTEPALLQLEGVRRIYDDAARTPGLRGVDFQVRRGEFVAIVGRSGSGKSTLLNILGLLDRPSSGQYRVNGVSTSSLSSRRLDRLRGDMFGFVFQDSHGVEQRTVAKNVEVPLAVHGMDVAAREVRVAEVLRMVGLTARANHLVRELSGGERQRMAIARAIAHSPEVLLVDEPTGSLDVVNADAIHSLLVSLNERGMTIVVVTHDERLADLAHRRLTISDGTVQEDVVVVPPKPAAHPSPAIQRAAPFRSYVLDELAEWVMGVADRGLKSVLSIIVIAFGVAGLVAGVGVNAAAASQVNDLFNRAALDEVRAATRVGAPGFDSVSVKAARDIDGVLAAGLLYSIPSSQARITRVPSDVGDASAVNLPVIGATGGTLEVFGVHDATVYAAALDDPVLGRRSILLGAVAAEKLGMDAPAVGMTLWVNGASFYFAGVVTPDSRHANVAEAAIVSDLAVQSFIAPGENPTLVLRTEMGMSNSVATALPFAIDPLAPENTVPQSTADLAELRASVDGSLSGLFFAMAGILLLVAVLSTSSSLGSTVIARQKQIGLWRALGISRARVAARFTGEGVVLGLLGGVLGAAIGTAILITLTLIQDWPSAMEYWPAIAAIGVGVGTGALASTFPATRASALDPSTALRS